MKQLFIILSLVVPIGLLTLFRLFPGWDPIWRQPLLHFYLVTFFTFTAVVVALFTALLLGHQSRPRHQLLATAFAVMGLLFFVHGITTPQAILFTPNPGIRWAAWLTLFVGGLIFAVATLDKPQRPLQLQYLRIIHGALVFFCAGFILIVMFRPQWLTAVDEQVAPWHEQIVAVSTFLFWLFAAVGLARTWRQTQGRVDGTMALIAAWIVIGTVSLHVFTVWQFSWWIYHIQLLMGVVLAVVILVSEYEQLRRFRLTHYYAVIGLIITAALALAASHLFSRSVERYLVFQIAESEMITAVVQARLNGLIIASLSLGLLYTLMLVVVHRADRLLTIRNDELVQAYANLQAAEVMRDDLTDMIVHDLRTPLTSLDLSLNLLEMSLVRPEPDKEYSRFLAGAKDSSQRMLHLINQLLDVARFEAGQLPVHPEVVHLEALISATAASFASQAEASHKQIEIDISPGLPPASLDPELIGRVLENLVGNALKYTTAEGHISLRARQNGQAFLVQVADDGEGIAPEALPRIFDKFYQVTDEAGNPVRRGTGLGLTFCKQVVEAHHGRIWVESTPGQGSTFSFTLPA